MKARLADYCIRCGICEDLYPDLFKRNYENHCIDILYNEIPESLQERMSRPRLTAQWPQF